MKNDDDFSISDINENYASANNQAWNRSHLEEICKNNNRANCASANFIIVRNKWVLTETRVFHIGFSLEIEQTRAVRQV